VIYGIVTDESMGNAVKVTVIATGFNRPRKVAPTPVDIGNYMTAPNAQAASGAGASPADFYRKTPNAKAASGGGRFDLDVPAFLRRKGGDAGNE
jgi:cell division GTPase FtsZ